MGSTYASGRIAIAECDRCGQRYKLKELKTEVIKTKRYELKVCPECWDPDQPQLLLGMYPVEDPQALRGPRRDTTYVTAGVNGLQLNSRWFWWVSYWWLKRHSVGMESSGRGKKF
jgi:NAD-dependent SIR2 family protein deacetylase